MKNLIVILLLTALLFSCQKNADKVAPEIAQKYLQDLENLPQKDKSILREFISLRLAENDLVVNNQKNANSINIIGSLNPEREKRVVFATFYDLVDEQNCGTLALLLSLSAIIDLSHQHQFGVDLVFMDNHNENSDSLKFAGAKLFTQKYEYNKESKIVFIQDILGSDLSVKIDSNSHKKSYKLVETIWRNAYNSGVAAFSSEIIENKFGEQNILSNAEMNAVLLRNYSAKSTDNIAHSLFTDFQQVLLELAYVQD